MKTDSEIEEQIARGQKAGSRGLWFIGACGLICNLPIDWGWKVLPGCIVAAGLLCAGPLLMVWSGGCGCGHPSCDVCNYWKRKNLS
jgi:hypothetical protein